MRSPPLAHTALGVPGPSLITLSCVCFLVKGRDPVRLLIPVTPSVTNTGQEDIFQWTAVGAEPALFALIMGSLKGGCELPGPTPHLMSEAVLGVECGRGERLVSTNRVDISEGPTDPDLWVAMFSPLSVAPRPTVEPAPSVIHPAPPPVLIKGPPSPAVLLRNTWGLFLLGQLCPVPPHRLHTFIHNAPCFPKISLPQVPPILDDPEKVLPPKPMST